MVHGGAWDIPDDELEAHRAGVLAAVRLGFGLLGGGASALDAVESAVALLEDDRALNAGAGAVLNRFGEAVLDGSIMDGADLRVGGGGRGLDDPEPGAGGPAGSGSDPAGPARRARGGGVRRRAGVSPDPPRT